MTMARSQVEDTTFGLDVGGLIQHSDPLRQILQLEPADGSEGTDNNPIIINGVTVQRFESFITWLNHLWVPGCFHIIQNVTPTSI